MMYIAHRGNTKGPSPTLENTPAYIQLALDVGFYVEVDVWGVNGTLWLGHDYPTTRVTVEYFREREIQFFCHCKNVEAMNILQNQDHCPTFFFHDHDDYTMTNDGFVWCYPGKTPSVNNSILVMPEKFMDIHEICEYSDKYNLSGICSDYISNIQAWSGLGPEIRHALIKGAEIVRVIDRRKHK